MVVGVVVVGVKMCNHVVNNPGACINKPELISTSKAVDNIHVVQL